MTELQKTLREALIVSLRELENQNSENDQLLGALVSDRDILERLPTALTHLEKILVGALNSVNKTLDDSSRTVNGLNTKLAGLLEDGLTKLEQEHRAGERAFQESTQSMAQEWRAFLSKRESEWKNYESALDDLQKSLSSDTPALQEALGAINRSLYNYETQTQQQNETIRNQQNAISQLHKRLRELENTTLPLTQLSDLTERLETMLKG